MTASKIKNIEIRGARTHNLKNVDLDVPRGKLTVITGVSGSGKSSLAFDTLFAEGQRQYLESLSSYARQFLDQMERPDVDSVRGLQPTLCIDQQQGVLSPRSTVGTVTEIYDYLRLFMARVAIPACHQCGSPIDRQPPSQITDAIAGQPTGTKITLLSPMVIGRKGTHAEVFERVAKAGLLRVRVDGESFELESLPTLAARREHSISAVVDRIVLREDSRERIEQAIQVALRLSDGLIESSSMLPDSEDVVDRLFSTRYACLKCGLSLLEIEPRTFSFNSQYGACPTCHGFGYIQEDACMICSSCHGQRLRPESLAIKLGGLSISHIVSKSMDQLQAWLGQLQLTDAQSMIAEPILKEVAHRLGFLQDVGLRYLTLDRHADSLSGGELQRVRLATSIGTGLTGVCYVLDEPSVGLHPSDTQRLIQTIQELRARGNSVVVVEHDEDIMRAADVLVDIGPGAGTHGGTISAIGTPDSFIRNGGSAHPNSLTAKYLGGGMPMPSNRQRPRNNDASCLRLVGITRNNLVDASIEIPLGRLVGITGVSGSGKSTLVHDSLSVAVRNLLRNESLPKHVLQLEGIESIDKLIEIDQSPIGRSPRSIPATYCGFWDEIRKVYAKTRDAKQRGYSAARFSFNSGQGRCEACTGQGRIKLEMSFLADVFVPCTQCRTRRFNRSTLAVRFKNMSIADCLEMNIAQAMEFFEAFPKIHRSLRCLVDVGLGYIALGQPSTTLSGGEAQRIKLANELSQSDTGRTLYLLDEPTTGLHIDDVVRLVGVLQALVDKGNTVIVVEHQMELIRSCDWVVDMGPGGGSAGGKILYAGEPWLMNSDTPTGLALMRLHG
ncbi:MAG: excinuclease ABC subunit UvrA [Pirellula sp.]